jgi:poly(A) polymerase
MERIGLLQQLIGTPPHIDSFARLGILERALPPYDEKAAWVLRLAALVGPDSLNGDLAAMVAHRLKLSRVEQARLSRMVANMAHPLDAAMSEDAARAAIYRLSPNGFLDWLVASWTVNEGGTMGDYARLAALALHWKPPEFPLSGRDIAAHGVAPGPAVGEALRVLEEVWISSDFQLTKDQLLERMGHRLH